MPAILEKRARRAVPLRDFTSFRVGGPADRLIEVEDPEDLAGIVRVLAPTGVAWRLLGGGTNLLIDDRGLDGLSIVFRSSEGAVRLDGQYLVAYGGAELAAAVRLSVEAGLAGLDFAAGIPGTVGGAIAGNAGAFGRQVGDVLAWVRLLSRDGRERRAAPGELGFAYRDSKLKRTGEVVLEAAFLLHPADRLVLRSKVEEILEFRRQRHPDWRTIPTAGSFFRNLAPASAVERRQAAGALLEQVGAKGRRVGGAAVFERHANILVNAGGARAVEVIELAGGLRRDVHARFGVWLRREVQIWPPQIAPELPDREEP